ncbi:MAG: hypothetical protein ACLTQI_05940 [Slackia sp.]
MKRWIAGIAAGLVFVIAVILIARHLSSNTIFLMGQYGNPNQPAVASNQDYGKVENELVELSWYQDTMSHDDCFSSESANRIMCIEYVVLHRPRYL